MTPLDGALALAQADHVPVLVGQDLELDVARPLDIFFHVEIAVAERPRGFADAWRNKPALLFAADNAHAASAASRRRFDNHRIADLACPLDRFPFDAITPSDPGKIGTPAFFIAARAFSFSPIRRMTSGGGPMNLMRRFRTLRRNSRSPPAVLAGMDRIHVGDFRGADHRWNIEIALGQLRRSMQMASSAKRTASELRSASL